MQGKGRRSSQKHTGDGTVDVNQLLLGRLVVEVERVVLEAVVSFSGGLVARGALVPQVDVNVALGGLSSTKVDGAGSAQSHDAESLLAVRCRFGGGDGRAGSGEDGDSSGELHFEDSRCASVIFVGVVVEL